MPSCTGNGYKHGDLMALSVNENGFSTFVVSPHAIAPKETVFFRCIRDSGAQYIASRVENIYKLDQIQPGCTFSITVVTAGFRSITRIIPHEDGRICYRGHFLPGSALVSKNAKSGDYVKLASLEGKMWHVIESSGSWIKDGL